jgi:prepilin-type N-terminal cleavage/methylation domain-containing protein
MHKRPAFTIIEVLIAIALMGIILPALYESVALLRDSNTHLFKNLEKAKKVSQATDTLYLDLASSDGNISIKKDDFSRVCIQNTKNSLYGLSMAKVCWIVLKKEKTLLRVEGYGYDLPLRNEQNVEVDSVMNNVELFDVYHKKGKILVLLQQESKKPITFMIQGITKPIKKKIKKKKKKNTPSFKDRNTIKPPANSNPLVPPVIT